MKIIIFEGTNELVTKEINNFLKVNLPLKIKIISMQYSATTAHHLKGKFYDRLGDDYKDRECNHSVLIQYIEN